MKSSLMTMFCLLHFMSGFCLLYYWIYLSPGEKLPRGTRKPHSLRSHRLSKMTYHERPLPAQHSSVQSTTSSIPRILHQTWKTKYVHTSMSTWITSWSKHNPGWTRVFWTHDSLDQFVELEFPEHFSMFKGYRANISRADAARYLILYRYGGVYADLDLECLRPLEDILVSSSCLLTEQSSAVASLVLNLTGPPTANGFLACREGHPFLKMVLDELPVTKDIPNVLESTGPFLLNRIRVRYNSTLEHAEDITVLPSRFFLPTYQQKHQKTLVSRCLEILQPNQTGLTGSTELVRAQVDDCKLLRDRNFANVPFPESYSVHYWLHTWGSKNHAKYSGSPSKWTIAYEQLVPNVTLGEDFIEQSKSSYTSSAP